MQRLKRQRGPSKFDRMDRDLPYSTKPVASSQYSFHFFIAIDLEIVDDYRLGFKRL